MIELLQKNWRHQLSSIIKEAKEEVFISSPYATIEGANFILNQVSDTVRQKGKFIFLSNLSPQNITQGSTDSRAFEVLRSNIANFSLWHLPNLHAKVYVSDKRKAIITSGNLTAGGLFNNFEYGVQIDSLENSTKVYDDIFSYSQLGSNIDKETLLTYISISQEIKETYKKQQASTKESVTKRFNELFRKAEDELVKERLNVGAVHNIFSKTILYILKKYGGMATEQLHLYVQQIHPDLCDDSIDRVIDGKHYGKKWKHYVRNSQQHLKSKGLIELANGTWNLTS
jgi:phosphatidylserine/phosphatidylglycerophosphate/cardiolipin synthase-like enzyme